ncbi:hypothetical protein [Lachnobacterium bovis]|uniref:hypothetical protein n=1 Tax=Lachnobacterium bovis TaxID=140626 RepID=UPI00048E9B9D|nr:hypothetical protein [Lachnobacterium bovis]
MRISKYTILKYVCVLSLELVCVAWLIQSNYKGYREGKDKHLYAVEKLSSQWEKDTVVAEKDEKESLNQAFENRIQKGEVAKKLPGKYQCKFVNACKFEKNIFFTKYDIYNKKMNKKVGEGYIASVKEIDAIYKIYTPYITYIKVYNPSDKNENYEVKEPGYFSNFDFTKVEEDK